MTEPKDFNKELFRKAAFVWTLIVIVNVIVMVSFLSEGFFSSSPASVYAWALINFLPISLLIIYINLSKRNSYLRAKTNSNIIKVLFPIFGLLCLGSLILAQRMDESAGINLIRISPYVLLILQFAIWWYMPKLYKEP